MTKKINVLKAGQEQEIQEISVTDQTTAAQVLSMAGCPIQGYELMPGGGLPAFGKDERIFTRVKDGGKVIASPLADAGI
jgi:hypothetical protein